MMHREEGFVRHNKLMWTAVLLVVLTGVVTLASAQRGVSRTVLLATTNQGELVEVVIRRGTARARLIGDAGVLEDGREPGWTGLSFDSEGNLFVTSRHASELETDGCFGKFAHGPCSHLYRLDPRTGTILAEIGSTGVSLLSDIDFMPDGTLFGNYFNDERGRGDGALAVIDPSNAILTRIGLFGRGFSGVGLENGGLSVHPQTDEIWGVENSSSLSPSIFRVDPDTGEAVPESIVRLGINGNPSVQGADALEILPDGRFILIAGGPFQLSAIAEVNPIPDEQTGLAEITLIPLVRDPAITGKLNGFETTRQSNQRTR